ncbi:MAG: GTP 3',8-cyclase MoaA [bacterium JZ-2024 1]
MIPADRLVDRFGRHAGKLRVSVTDRCNLRCFYCMPRGRIDWVPRHELLHYGEFAELVRIMAGLGIRKVRLTGGEPLVRPELERLVVALKKIHSIERISMTTNGSFLADKAKVLKEAGLDSVNISLDTLRRGRFQEMTGVDAWNEVVRGISAAIEVGWHPIKINTVVVRGFNDDEILDLVLWAAEKGLILRFIEFMPLDGPGGWRPERVVSAKEILEELSRHGRVSPIAGDASDPARPFLFERGNLTTKFGIIASVSEPFCMNCDRLRLTARGGLRSCLFGTDELDLRMLLRNDATHDAIADAIRAFVFRKPQGHEIGKDEFVRPAVAMHYLGG